MVPRTACLYKSQAIAVSSDVYVPQVFEVLIERAFAQAEASRLEQTSPHVNLLALAAAAVDDRCASSRACR